MHLACALSWASGGPSWPPPSSISVGWLGRAQACPTHSTENVDPETCLGPRRGLRAAAGLVCTPTCLGPRRGLRAAAGLVCTGVSLGLCCSRAGVHRNLLGALGGLRAAAGLVCTPTCLGLWKLGACLKLQGPARKANQQGLRKLQGASGNLGRPQRKSHLSTCCVLWMLKIKNFPRFARCCKRVYDLIKCKRTSPKNAAKNKNPNFDLRAGPEGTSCPQGQYQKTKNFPNLCT